MFEDIKDKKVLITGASGGIGGSIAKIFMDYNAYVGLHYNQNIKNVLNLSNEKSRLLPGNLLEQNVKETLISQFINYFGGIDVLINNAGAHYNYVGWSELDEKSWDDSFNLNVKAPFYLSKNAFEYMKQKGGRIINISSANVKYGGSAKSVHYVASKSALESLTKTFAKEGAKYGILVNTIRAGVIESNMRDKLNGYSKEQFEKRIKLIPLGRIGKLSDIANMVLFLSSECGNFITGETFTVAGGD